MKRVACFIDGFNMYHAIDNRFATCYKWCNYRALINGYLQDDEQLDRVLYFSAFARWDTGKVARHNMFIKALSHHGIEVIMGKFKKKKPFCKKCSQRYTTHEEKESDVNIAIHMVSMAYEDDFDTALLVSGDSDFVSTIQFLKEKFDRKKFGVIVPGNLQFANDLRNVAHFSKHVDFEHIKTSRLPDEITLEDGTLIKCPPEYLIPGS